ncbi:MAG TPA: CoA transferase [Acidobacteriota bacterium]
MPSHSPGPLSGLRVLDLSRVLSGPYCTMQLADMGAEVIKVEVPGRGDDTRAWGPPFVGGESAYFLSINRNKKSITLNLRSPEGADLLRRLLRVSDVLVENFRPGVMDRLGFGYATCSQLRPELVYCSVSGFGHSGPRREEPGYDIVLQGEGGIQGLTGSPGGPGFRVGVAQADLVAGLFACQGILLALFHRQRSGAGQWVDVAMLDAQIALLTYQAGNFFASGAVPQRLGNRHPNIAPYETFATADDDLNLAIGNQKLWRDFCRLVGLEALADDPRFATNADRLANYEPLRAWLAPLFAARPCAEWIELLRGRGIPCGPVRDLAQVFGDPQVAAREMVCPMEHPRAGHLRTTGVPVKLSATPGAVSQAPPELGQHNHEIYSGLLGLEAAELAELAGRGVI